MHNPELKTLNRISPSRYTALGRCSLCVILSNSLDYPLLPYSPNNHLGNIIHKTVEHIIKGEVQNSNDFNKIWTQFQEEEEQKLIAAGFNIYVPISKSVSGFTIKKLLTRSILDRKKINIDKKHDDAVITSEKWLESKDKKIGGYIDIIYSSNEYIKIVDLKTGRISEDGNSIKEDYETQVKLYAFLYYENNNRFPNDLAVIDIQHKEYNIPFEGQECLDLANKAVKLLNALNNKIEAGQTDELANPDPEYCSFCLYRPACNKYWSHIKVEDQKVFCDLKGKLLDFRVFENGSINIYLDKGTDKYSICHIDNGMAEILPGLIDKEIFVYNVIRTQDEMKFKALKTTNIYE